MDFRGYINLLNENNLLYNVSDEVHWKYEIGKISRDLKNRAILFKNIKDYNNYKLFTGGLSSCKYISILLKMPIDSTKREIVNELRNRLQTPIEPLVENQMGGNYIWEEGKSVNLYSLSAPWWHPLDGGRYIGTWHINVSKDIDTNKRNVGVYRMQIKGRNYATVSVSPLSHLAFHIKRAEEQGKNLQMAVAIGVDEAIVMAGASAIPQHMDEYTIAGAIQKRSVKLVKCKTVDLEVPSNAEIVLEGIIRSGVRMQDGPYFDYSGKISVNKKAYCFEVKAIKRKEFPIFRGMSVGEAGAEDHLLFSILSHLNMVDFHGSPVRQKVQNFLLRNGFYNLFQLMGRIGNINRKKQD